MNTKYSREYEAIYQRIKIWILDDEDILLTVIPDKVIKRFKNNGIQIYWNCDTDVYDWDVIEEP